MRGNGGGWLVTAIVLFAIALAAPAARAADVGPPEAIQTEANIEQAVNIQQAAPAEAAALTFVATAPLRSRLSHGTECERIHPGEAESTEAQGGSFAGAKEVLADVLKCPLIAWAPRRRATAANARSWV